MRSTGYVILALNADGEMHAPLLSMSHTTTTPIASIKIISVADYRMFHQHEPAHVHDTYEAAHDAAHEWLLDREDYYVQQCNKLQESLT